VCQETEINWLDFELRRSKVKVIVRLWSKKHFEGHEFKHQFRIQPFQ